MGPKSICKGRYYFNNRKYTAKVGQDNVNIGVVTIFRLANTSLLQVYWMELLVTRSLYLPEKA